MMNILSTLQPRFISWTRFIFKWTHSVSHNYLHCFQTKNHKTYVRVFNKINILHQGSNPENVTMGFCKSILCLLVLPSHSFFIYLKEKYVNFALRKDNIRIMSLALRWDVFQCWLFFLFLWYDWWIRKSCNRRRFFCKNLCEVEELRNRQVLFWFSSKVGMSVLEQNRVCLVFRGISQHAANFFNMNTSKTNIFILLNSKGKNTWHNWVKLNLIEVRSVKKKTYNKQSQITTQRFSSEDKMLILR